jgi:hypothetical protein
MFGLARKRPLFLLACALVVVLAALLIYSALRAGWTWQGWTAVAAIATFLAVLAALGLGIWGDELRTLGRGPRLSLTLDPAPDHFQRFITSPGIAEYDVRISVINQGEFGARNVEVVALELLVKGADGQFTRDPVFMAMNLKRSHLGDTITPMVHRGVPRPYDLLACYDPQLQKIWKRTELRFDLSTLVSPVAAESVTPSVITPAAPGQAVTLPEMFPSSKAPGSYRLVLAVAADEVVPVRRVVEVTWSGTWSNDASDFFKNELNVRFL